MTRGVFLTAGLMCLGMMAALTAADDEQPKSIKEVMALHKKDQLRQQIQADLKAPSPNWAELQKKTKTYAANAQALAGFDPPKGDKAGYEKLAKSFSEAINALDKGAQAKDAQAAQAAFQNSGGFCMKCHQAHRP